MNKEIKRICNKKPEDVTMIEYQNLKSSMLNQLGRTKGTCEGVWCTDCCLSPAIIGNSCSTIELTDTQKAIELVQEWHKEHTLKIDWSKVPVDTLIWVWDKVTTRRKRHFAKYEDGNIYAWFRGATSWSVDYDGADYVVTQWEYAELAEVADE